MHNLLEKYLADVADGLQFMPMARRNEELHEIRQHLLNTVTVNQEAGQSENEAVLTTLKQFGEPIDLGQNLFTTWQRGEAKQDKRSYWGAAVCVIVLLWVGGLLLKLLFGPNLNPDLKHVTYKNADAVHMALVWVPIIGIGSIFLSGFVTGVAFPRKGVPGTALGMTLLYAISMCIQFTKHVPLEKGSLEIVYAAIGAFGNLAIFSLLAVLGAWAGRKLCLMPIRLMCDDQ